MTEKKLEKKGWKNLLKFIKNADDLGNLLKALLTEEEQVDLSKRVLIIKALLKGERTQREIAKDLQVSIAKITRGSNMLKIIDSPLRKFLEGEL